MLPATPFHQSTLVWSLRSLVQPDVDTREFVSLSTQALQQRYREIASAPAPVTPDRYWGKAQGCNVLFVVLETAPARILPADGDLSDFPNLRRLRKTAFVGVSHYSTYPETHQAIFSVFTSWYPSSVRNFYFDHSDLVIPGMIRTLSQRGYDTAVYSPWDFRGERDREMYKSLGFQRQLYPEERRLDSELATRMALDTAALNLLKGDLEMNLKAGRRFAYLFAPELSHGPWSDLKRRGEE